MRRRDTTCVQVTAVSVVTELPELQTTWGHGLSKATGQQMARLALYFPIIWAGGGRITQPECLRTLTNGITFKPSDLINRMQNTARLGTWLFLTAALKGASEGRTNRHRLGMVGPSTPQGVRQPLKE